MLRFLLFIAMTFLPIAAMSQNSGNLVVFSPEGKAFWAVLDGVRQNKDPQANVKITDLPSDLYKLNIIFQDTTLGEVNKKVMINKNKVGTAKIVKSDTEGKESSSYEIRYMADSLRNDEIEHSGQQRVIKYRASLSSKQPVTQQTKTKPQRITHEGFQQSMKGSPHMGAHDNVTSTKHMSQMSTTETTTTDTTASDRSDHDPMPGYNGPTGCDFPMSDGDFASAKESIKSKSLEEAKLNVAKQIAENNCLKVAQVKRIVELFGFEDTRLAFAKFAYEHTYDRGNYHEVNDAFSFKSSVKEMKRFVLNNK